MQVTLTGQYKNTFSRDKTSIRTRLRYDTDFVIIRPRILLNNYVEYIENTNVKRVDNIQKWMASGSRKMKTVRRNQKAMLDIKHNSYMVCMNMKFEKDKSRAWLTSKFHTTSIRLFCVISLLRQIPTWLAPIPIQNKFLASESGSQHSFDIFSPWVRKKDLKVFCLKDAQGKQLHTLIPNGDTVA